MDALEQVLVEMPMEPGMIVVDMYGAFGDEDLTGVLYDQLHFNDEGHQIYAENLPSAGRSGRSRGGGCPSPRNGIRQSLENPISKAEQNTVFGLSFR